ncbi:MAG TPA: hypothetical protein DCE78_11395 [Bacteroidetes bacterium]|nr:hypothetical protein [Bacteroidota bacterium]
MQRSEQVQSSMETVDNDIKLVIVRLDAIGASLDELVKPSQSDRKRAFDVFSENVSTIKKMQENFSKHAADMESNGKEYFAEWDKNNEKYDNPEIQIQSEQRRVELARTYDKIALNNIGVKSAFVAYVTDVNEIERFLSNDLTEAGMESISRISSKVVDNGTRLKNELSSLQGAIEEAREKMKSN